jgi:hypothetical protein
MILNRNISQSPACLKQVFGKNFSGCRIDELRKNKEDNSKKSSSSFFAAQYVLFAFRFCEIITNRKFYTAIVVIRYFG